MSNTLEIRIISATDEEIYRVSGDTKLGAVLSASFNWDKIGGLREFELNLPRNYNIPLGIGSRIEFYFRDEIFLQTRKIYTGYVTELPSSSTEELVVTLSGKGYYWKLENKTLTTSYAATSIENIILAMDYTGLDLDLSAFDVADATYTITEISFEDKTYIQVLDRLLQIANAAYSTTQFIWGVNEDRGIYFSSLPSTGTEVRSKLFEGYQFQAPEVEIGDEVINRVTAYRATKADPKQTELVAVYDNLESQARNGVINQKIVSDDYVDTVEIARIADGILEEYAEPKLRITASDYFSIDAEPVIDNFVVDDNGSIDNLTFVEASGTSNAVLRLPTVDIAEFDRILPADFYGISTKPQEKTFVLTDCETLDDWTESTPNSTASITDLDVATGRNAILWERVASQPAGDYLEFELSDYVIDGLLSVSFFLKFKAQVPDLTVEIFDRKGESFTVAIEGADYPSPDLEDTWLELIIPLDGEIVEGVLHVQGAVLFRPFGVQLASGDSKHKLGVSSLNPQLSNFSKIRFTLGEGTVDANSLVLDRVSARNKGWSYDRLELETAKYEISKNLITGQVTFGNTQESLISELLGEFKKGDIAYDLYARS